MSKKFQFDADAVRQLAQILSETGLSEIEYENEGCRIYVARQLQPVQAHVSAPPSIAIAPSASQPSPEKQTPKNDWNTHPGAVRSPMVGTAYLCPEPGAPSFIKIGDSVAVGQTLLIVEAMKVMNQIKATKAGKVVHIAVADGKPVEYDEPLVVIE